MRVAVLTSLWPWSARPHEGRFAQSRWQAFARRGHLVRVVQPMPRAPLAAALLKHSWAQIALAPGAETRGGLSVQRPRYWHFPGSARANAARFARAGMQCICDWPSNEQPQVLVCDYAWPAAAAAPLARQRGLCCVISGRGSDVLQVAGEAGLGAELAAYLQSAGHWLAVSQDLVDTMDRLGAAPGRGLLLPNGVDSDCFHLRDRAHERALLGLPETGPLVLCIGHLIERKDPLLALESFALARADLGPAARLVFFGSGPLQSALLQRVRALGLKSSVEVRGELEPEVLARWYGACDVLLLTSRREGRPNVVLEALASGRAVLATRAGGTEELLGADPRMLAPDRDPGRLAALLVALCAEPPEAQRLIASVEQLHWENTAAQLEGYLEGVLQGARVLQA